MKYMYILLLLAPLISYSQTVENLAIRAESFIQSLNAEQQATGVLPFDSELRTKWTNLPVGMRPRPGLQYGSLSSQSKIAFHELLTTLLSSQGYLKITSIMELDDILNKVYLLAFEEGQITEENYENIQGLDWAYGSYFITIWGKPSNTEPWGLKLGGHHISMNFTCQGENISVTPFFIGSDPAEVRTTQHAGLRVLSKEEDYGFKLIQSLNAAQRTKATLSQEVPQDIITNPEAVQRIDDYYGIPVRELDGKQRIILTHLLLEYINNLEVEKAGDYRQKIEKVLNDSYFAWIGSYERRSPHYYIVNGPNFLIEYDNSGFQDDGNHIHAIWREKGNDFGEDILRAHYEQNDH